ncbi:hypothetical protein [Frankia sp. CiP3]|uniref:hypothetical protein n=1 Tax=Frankia sp. CiP3 TaxID=2880971 RepID=UPI001EF4406B|nr:hypothetical protein [Frankia sp. CiP3]
MLSVPPRRLARVERCLAAQEVTVLDAESALLAGMRDFCERHRVAWALVLEADAAERTSREWASLSKVAQAGMTAVRASVEAAGPAVLLVNSRYAGPVRRFADPVRRTARIGPDGYRRHGGAHGVGARTLGRYGEATPARRRRPGTPVREPVAGAVRGVDCQA